MDKISSIVPATARVTTVDLKSSGVSRSGTPGFGREVNSTNLDRLHHPETAQMAMERHTDQMTLRQPTATEKADTISKMTDKFFNTKARENELPEIKAEEKYSVEDMGFGSAVRPTLSQTSPNKGGIHQAQAQQMSEELEEDAPQVGSRLDVRA